MIDNKSVFSQKSFGESSQPDSGMKQVPYSQPIDVTSNLADVEQVRQKTMRTAKEIDADAQ